MTLGIFSGTCRSSYASITGHVSQQGWTCGQAPAGFLIPHTAAFGGNVRGTSFCPAASVYGFCKSMRQDSLCPI